jgi:hypothetical protein
LSSAFKNSQALDQYPTSASHKEIGKMKVNKAEAADFLGRFREIIADPLNILIKRHPLAGTVQDNLVYLHNGNRVPLSGPDAYYGDFSNILVINRGVHEPLEEYVFQELLEVLPETPSMLELGAYWGHYSMWLKKMRPQAVVHLVEPDESNLKTGLRNFQYHGYEGDFIQAFVGRGHFEIDAYFKAKEIPSLNILHADIQGFEIEMLQGGSQALEEKLIDYLFISTHSQELHDQVKKILGSFGYRIEVSADFDRETTSYDGLVFASSPQVFPLFGKFSPQGREKNLESDPADLLKNLSDILFRCSSR